MKKIIALILVLCCVFAISSCDFIDGIFGGEEEVDGIAEFNRLYSVSAPTKVVTSYTTELGGVTLTGGSTLKTGNLNDGSTATVLTYYYEVLQSVQTGAGDVITPIMGEPITGSQEYVEGKGQRIDGGGWDEFGMDFAPQAGSIAIKLDETLLTDCVYSESGSLRTLSFTVKAENTSAVFGEDYEIVSDASVVITANNAVITGITVSYSEPIVSDDEDIEYPTAIVTISTVYTYDIEEITLVK